MTPLQKVVNAMARVTKEKLINQSYQCNRLLFRHRDPKQ